MMQEAWPSAYGVPNAGAPVRISVGFVPRKFAAVPATS